LKNINPLAIQPVIIHRANRDQPATASASVSDNTKTLKRIGTALMNMLKAEYEEKKQPIRGVPAADAATQLRAQIRMYAQRKWPFDRPYNDNTTPMAWWKALSEHPDAQILAVSSFPPSRLLTTLILVVCVASRNQAFRHDTQFHA